MKEKEFKQIIDREKHKKDARQIFSKQIDLLVDLVNYGSNLIIRAYDSSKKKLEDAIVIGVLLKQVVAMIDATEILLCHGSPQSADIQLRSALEASLYIDWMLKSELQKKAKYYYISNLRNMKLWALKLKAFASQSRDLETLDPLPRVSWEKRERRLSQSAMFRAPFTVLQDSI